MAQILATVLGVSGLTIAVSSWTVFDKNTKKTKTILLAIAFVLLILAILAELILLPN